MDFLNRYTQSTRTGITLAGTTVDVHARWAETSCGGVDVAHCGVYVRPVASTVDAAAALVPGYWYFAEGAEAVTLLTVAGVLS